MKRINAILAALTAATMSAPLVLSAFAETAGSEDLYVTVSVANAGELEVALEQVPLTDADGNGSLTVNDVIITTHDMFYDGGAAAGYKTKVTDWGDSIIKLWGVENGGSYGYTVNDQFAYGLSDPVQDGDSVYFYVYKDAKYYTDTYTYFAGGNNGLNFEVPNSDRGSVALNLYSIVYDPVTWAPTVQPVEGAVITVNGERTDFVTDEDGGVSVSFDEDTVGDCIISAESDTSVIVPPVYRCQVVDSEEYFARTVTTETTEPDETTDYSDCHFIFNITTIQIGAVGSLSLCGGISAEFRIEDESIAEIVEEESDFENGIVAFRGLAAGVTTLYADAFEGTATATITVIDPATTTTVTSQTTVPDPDETTESTTSTDPIIETTEAETTTSAVVGTTDLTTVTEATTTTAPVGDLPQTGNNDATGMLVLLGTFALTGTGFTVLKRSGVFDSEE